MRLTTVLIAVLLSACGDSGAVPPISLAGTYDYRADGAVRCSRNTAQQCVCGEAGHHEGTLTLRASDATITGELHTRTCMPGEPCSATQVHPVVEAPVVRGDSVVLVMNTTSTIRPHHMQVHFARPSGGDLIGRYVRSDGSTNGCGDDDGPFQAVRRD